MTIETSKGLMDVALLERRTGTVDDKVELTNWTEYWFQGDTSCDHALEMPSRMCIKCPAELVHRSVDMQLKEGVFAEAVARSFV